MPTYTSWADNTFCTPADVQAVAGDLSLITLTSDPGAAMEKIATAIATGKERMRRDVVNKCQTVYPNTVDDAISRANYNVRRVIQMMDNTYATAGVDVLTFWLQNSYLVTNFFTDWILQNSIKPRFLWWYQAPVSGPSGTWATGSLNGDFLGDTVNKILYINVSVTENSPTWVQFIPDDQINYIANPEVLKEANVNAAIVAALESAQLRSTADGIANSNQMTQLLSYWVPRAEKTLKSCIQVLTIDISRGGSPVPPYFSGALNKRKLFQ